MNQIIFIVGMPRSGTSLINYILNAHSQIAITPETHFMDVFYRTIRSKSKNDIKDFTKKYLYSDDIKNLSYSSDELALLYRLLDDEKKTSKDLFLLMLKLYGEKHGKKIVGEKTPRHIEFIPTLKEWFPCAKFIIITRDPRDVSLSLEKVPWDKHNVYQHGKRWKKYTNLTKQYLLDEKLKHDLIEVKYEHLINYIEEDVYRLCQFLDIKYEEAMLKYYESSVIDSKELENSPWKKKNFKKVQSNNYNKWVDNMPLEKVFIMESVCKDSLSYYQYPFYKSFLQKRVSHNWIYKLYASLLLLVYKGRDLVESIFKRYIRMYNNLYRKFI